MRNTGVLRQLPLTQARRNAQLFKAFAHIERIVHRVLRVAEAPVLSWRRPLQPNFDELGLAMLNILRNRRQKSFRDVATFHAGNLDVEAGSDMLGGNGN